MSKRATASNPKHLPKSVLQLEHQMHMQSLRSELGKTCTPTNLGIYYSHKEILGYVSKCRNYKNFLTNLRKKTYGVSGPSLDLRPSFKHL
jgi:hypothetical protein